MKLKKMLFWKSSVADEQQASEPAGGVGAPTPIPHSNVVPLAGQGRPEVGGEPDPVTSDTAALVIRDKAPHGLLDAQELKDFFDSNHFGLGRHNGAHLRTLAAQELGKAGIVARFQNVLAMRVATLQGEADRLRNMQIQIEGVCSTTSAQLEHACERLERDIASLNEQSRLAAEGKGWVLAALNEYQIGFAKGLQEVVNGELLFK